MNLEINPYNSYKTQFEGGLNFISGTNTKAKMSYLHNAGNILGQDKKDLVILTQNASKKRFKFFKSLVNKYNGDNFYRKINEKEDSTFVNQIYKLVKKPNEIHFNIISDLNTSLENIKRIFDGAGNEQSRLKFVHSLTKEIFEQRRGSSKNLIPELLESKNSKEYIKNYKNYKSYLILNRENENAVKNLDKMLEEGKYNPKLYDTILKKQQIERRFPLVENSAFSTEIYVNNYTKEREKLLNAINYNFLVSRYKINSDNYNDILNMFMSTTPENINIRLKIIRNDKSVSNPIGSSEQLQESIAELNKLFEKIDSDRSAKKFINNLYKHPLRISSVKDINELLNNFSSKKLEIFKDNVRNIINKTTRENRISVIKNEIENPFFGEDKAKQYSTFTLLRKIIKNQFNILKYNTYKKNQ